MTAVKVYYHHRAALEYDFRARFGFGVERIDRQELEYSELTALIEGLLNDHTSHTYASACEWSYVPSPAEVAFYNEVDVKLAMNRRKNQPVPPPIERPWEKKKPTEFVPRFDPEREARRAKLNARLGIR